MRRKLGLAAVAGAVVFLGIGSLSRAADAPSNDANPQVLKLITRASAINDFVDTGAAGFTPGDLYIFSERLFLASAPSDQIGRADGRCVLIDPAVLRFDCSITSSLPDGDIVSEGTLTLVEGATSVGAITGGTRAYRKVRGEATLKLGPFVGPHEATFFLILNP